FLKTPRYDGSPCDSRTGRLGGSVESLRTLHRNGQSKARRQRTPGIDVRGGQDQRYPIPPITQQPTLTEMTKAPGSVANVDYGRRGSNSGNCWLRTNCRTMP